MSGCRYYGDRDPDGRTCGRCRWCIQNEVETTLLIIIGGGAFIILQIFILIKVLSI